MGSNSGNRELQELFTFGNRCELVEFPSIAVGGFIDFGSVPASNILPRRELQDEPSGKETGSSARPWERPQAEASAAGPPSYAEQRWLIRLGLEELAEYYPALSVQGGSSGFLSIAVPIGLFRSLPDRGLLILEVPTVEKFWREILARADRLVPDVRAWALWSDGTLVRSHHANPDLGICACLPGEWALGRDPLIDFVSYCTCWLGKVLFDTLFGHWPGPQHYGPRARRMRGKLDEFCGCGSRLRYRGCCHPNDSALSHYDLWRESWEAERLYLGELARQRRPRCPRFVQARMTG